MIQSTKAFIADQIERIERMKAQEPLNEINQEIHDYTNNTINRAIRGNI